LSTAAPLSDWKPKITEKCPQNELAGIKNRGYICTNLHFCRKSIFKEYIMAKGSHGKGGANVKAPRPTRGGPGGIGYIPEKPGGNKPSTTGKPSGEGRGNLPPKR
jgi:hypothetical protein